jgi:hypothetical protein
MDLTQTFFSKRLQKPIKKKLQAQALVAILSLILFPQHDLLTHKCLLHNLTLGHVREHSQAARVLTPFISHPHTHIF